MLQNPRVTSFTVSELLRQNQRGEGGAWVGKITPITQISVKRRAVNKSFDFSTIYTDGPIITYSRNSNNERNKE